MFECFATGEGKRKFRLKAEDGQTILSSQAYLTKEACHAAVYATQKSAWLLQRFQRMTSSNGEPYFALIEETGDVLGLSAMYVSPAEMENGIQAVMIYAPRSTIEQLA